MEAVLAADLLAMLDTLPHDLRGLRDRAILLVGFAGGLRRGEMVCLHCGPDQTEDGAAGSGDGGQGPARDAAQQDRLARDC